jgi:hypothetical protein
MPSIPALPRMDGGTGPESWLYKLTVKVRWRGCSFKTSSEAGRFLFEAFIPW